MDIYHSFWDLGYSNLGTELYNMHKLSVLTALKNYGNIHLITTQRGKEFLGDLPYTSIELYEEDLPLDLKDTWSLSKVYAYRQIARKGRPFFHIDYDVFLFSRLAKEFEEAQILVQHIETGKAFGYYHIDVFFENCPNHYLGNRKIDRASNMGIFGGNALGVIESYVDEAIKLLLDNENKVGYWKKPNLKISRATKSVVLEQWYLNCCLDKFGVEITPLLTDSHIDREAIEKGYCHLWGDKSKPQVHQKIRDKLELFETIE